MKPTREELATDLNQELMDHQGGYKTVVDGGDVKRCLMLVLDWLAAQEKPAPVAAPAPPDEDGLVEKVMLAIALQPLSPPEAAAVAAIAAMREAGFVQRLGMEDAIHDALTWQDRAEAAERKLAVAVSGLKWFRLSDNELSWVHAEKVLREIERLTKI